MSNLSAGQPQNDSTRRDDWRHRDPMSRAMGGMVLILLGVIFFIAQNQMFGVTWSNMWGAFLMGLGVLLILQAFARFIMPAYRHGALGLVVGGAVLIAIGSIPFGGTMWAQWWPLGLIVLGVALLIQQFVGW